MHLIGVRRTLAEKHPWLPAAVLKAFEQSKAAAVAHLWDTSATKVTLPFIEERVAEVYAADLKPPPTPGPDSAAGGRTRRRVTPPRCSRRTTSG